MGSDLGGRHSSKRLHTCDKLDQFLDKMDDPDYGYTVHAWMTGRDLWLTDEQVALVRWLQKGELGDMSFNLYELAVHFFTGDLVIHSVTNRPADKQSFIPSLVEKEKVCCREHMPLRWAACSFAGRRTPPVASVICGRRRLRCCAGPTQDAQVRSHAGPAHHTEFYDLPPAYPPGEEEWEQWEPGERKPSFPPHEFSNLRAVPVYSCLLQERFMRCLDLCCAHGQCKRRVNVVLEDLIPKLSQLQDLQPFLIVLVYRGHSNLVHCLSVILERASGWLQAPTMAYYGSGKWLLPAA